MIIIRLAWFAYTFSSFSTEIFMFLPPWCLKLSYKDQKKAVEFIFLKLEHAIFTQFFNTSLFSWILIRHLKTLITATNKNEPPALLCTWVTDANIFQSFGKFRPKLLKNQRIVTCPTTLNVLFSFSSTHLKIIEPNEFKGRKPHIKGNLQSPWQGADHQTGHGCSHSLTSLNARLS